MTIPLNGIPQLRYVMVADKLRKKILDGEYRPGERLPRQHDLATEFNVAFTTLKRALDILEREGYLVRKIGQGTYAALPEDHVTTVLVVDDEEQVCDLFAEILKNSRYDVVTVESGEMAVEKVREQRFDVIFLDLIMPGMNGVDTLREIRRVGVDASVVIVTGYPNSDLVWEALEIGPFVLMKKPFDPDQVRAIAWDLAQATEVAQTSGS